MIRPLLYQMILGIHLSLYGLMIILSYHMMILGTMEMKGEDQLMDGVDCGLYHFCSQYGCWFLPIGQIVRHQMNGRCSSLAF